MACLLQCLTGFVGCLAGVLVAPFFLKEEECLSCAAVAVLPQGVIPSFRCGSCCSRMIVLPCHAAGILLLFFAPMFFVPPFFFSSGVIVIEWMSVLLYFVACAFSALFVFAAIFN